MLRLSRRIAVACLSSFVVVSLVAGSAPAGARLSDARRADRAVGFLADAQRRNGSIPAFSRIGSTADAVLAFVAAGSGRREARRALAFLASRAEAGRVATEGLKAKVVLAFAAAGRPARRIGGQRFVRELRLGYADGLEHTVFDTALAVLAIRAAGATVPDDAVQLLVDEQCPDGGWAFDRFDEGGEDEHCFSGDAGSDFFLSDTNTTALAVQALVAVGVEPATNPFPFLREIRDDVFGGWGYTHGFATTDANSTALVLQAFAAAGKTPPAAARRALRALQHRRCGAFGFTFAAGERTDPDVGATIAAVPGLLGRAMPFTGEAADRAVATPACLV